jgi:glucose/arabinose dehydrogenase
MIEMIIGIFASGIVSHPLIPFGVDVRSFGMVRLIAEGASLISCGGAEGDWLAARQAVKVTTANRKRFPRQLREAV